MKASLRWLRELCPGLPDDPAMVAARLTAAGLEVEGTLAFGLGAEACVVASVVATRPHPSRSGLRLVTVDRGAGAHPEIVCGAPNVPDPGGLVVLAPLGTHLAALGMTIEKRTIAGVPSEGMLCSEAELGLGDEGGGILVLPAGTAAPGAVLARALPASRDTIFEIGLTPNRPDGLGHLGLAREAAAIFGLPFAPPRPSPPERLRDQDLADFISVTIEDPERCPNYGAAVLLGATVAPSPLDVRWRLASLGVRSISNLVDVTNLIMLETGHPLHAFDLDKVRGQKIVVRRATEGEKLVTLDGVERTLTTDDLVICDGEGPVGLGGVMGGGNSEISASTTRVLLECAYFDARGVRRTARRHGLHTEASHRYERGVDWDATGPTLASAVSLASRMTQADAIKETRIFVARAQARHTVALRHERIERLLGVAVPPEEAKAALERLGFVCLSSQPGMDVWEAPSFRPDVTREVDLVEEIARVRGFDAIPAAMPAFRASRDAGPREALRRRAREAGVALGLSEAITYSFVAPSDLELVGAPTATVTLANPLSERGTVMRTSLLPGLLRALSHARRHGEHDARLFTVGTLFFGAAATPATAAANVEGAPSGSPLPPQEVNERVAFAAVLAGNRPAWLDKPQPLDVWDAKGLAEGMTQRLLGRAATLRLASAEERPKHLHPRGAAWVEVDGRRVGSLGPLHPDVADAFQIAQGSVAVELDLLELDALGPRARRFVPLPRFPSSTRDLAVVVGDTVAAGAVEHAVSEVAGELAETVTLFDRFVGGNVPPGHASLALHIVYRAADRTLTDAEVDQRHARVVAEVEKRFSAQLRA